MSGWHERPVAAVPGYAALWLIQQGRRGGVDGARVRAQVAMWRGVGRPDLADQLEMGWAQLKVTARAYQDGTGLDLSAGESTEAKAGASEGASLQTDEITSREAGDMLGGVTAQRVGQLVRQGRITGRRVGRSLMVDRASVVTELERRSAS